MPDPPTELLGPMSGRSERVTVTLTGLTARPTSKGPRYVYGNFGSDFMQALHKQLVGPKRRGLLRSKLHCPRCDRSLDATEARPVAVAADVELSKIPPIHLEIEMPGWECEGCGRRIVMIHDRNMQSTLTDALIDAFNRAGLAP